MKSFNKMVVSIFYLIIFQTGPSRPLIVFHNKYNIIDSFSKYVTNFPHQYFLEAGV